MGGKTDIVKGRIEEAAGVLTNNDNLRQKGRAAQEVGKVKEVIQNVADTVKDAASKVVAKAKDASTNAGK
jgi:uncharacterized protein YjbJ (UPF0337 family)